MAQEKPNIEVFITSTHKLRAKIKECNGEPPYEVTIGGNSWQEGRGQKYRDVIFKKAQSLIKNAVAEYSKEFECDIKGFDKGE